MVAAMPFWWNLRGLEHSVVWLVQGMGLFGVSVVMYTTLVYLTGAKPAEYYSVRKRAGYRDYQRTTNRFFPWFPKPRVSDAQVSDRQESTS